MRILASWGAGWLSGRLGSIEIPKMVANLLIMKQVQPSACVAGSRWSPQRLAMAGWMLFAAWGHAQTNSYKGPSGEDWLAKDQSIPTLAPEQQVWVRAPAGTFPMGARPGPDCLQPADPIQAFNAYRDTTVLADEYQGPHWDEAPVHSVTLGAPFELGARPVTGAEFSRYKPEHRKEYEAVGKIWDPHAPVVLVNWEEATDYCRWLTEQDRKEGRLAADLEYRLPTEAEWEYVAQRAQAEGREFAETGDHGDWCLDWWAPYADTPETDPVGPEKGTIRVYRGMRNSRGAKRITDRGGTLPADRMSDVSFRLARAKKGFRGTFRPPEPVARVFQEVNQKKFDWKPAKTEPPFFSGAGGEYISRQQKKAMSLPYWGRHHVPSITWCDNGDLLATVMTAPNDGSGQMAILLTRRRAGQEQWDPPARFFILPDREICAAILYHDRDGTIHHYSSLGPSDGMNFKAVRRVSHDHGATWSQPEIVSFWPFSDFPKNSFRRGDHRFAWIQLDLMEGVGGSLVMARDTLGQAFGTAYFKSTDHGRNWHEITRTGWQADRLGKDGGQAGWAAGWHAPLMIGADGSLRAIGRTDSKGDIHGHAPLSVSTDGGKTWTYGPSGFPGLSSAQRPVIRRLLDGSWLAVWFTDSSERSIKRKDPEGLRIRDASGKERRVYGSLTALSFDDGQTWKYHKLLPLVGPWEPFWAQFQYHQKPQSDVTGYFSVTQTPDGIIHLINTHRYCSFNPAWLKEPMPALSSPR
ncbi:MAG: hypothetical protein EBS90_09315 [Betaproteobacteria bacterium]|nr:hypothetical protein [Betaproteobacteria bacterium]